MTDIASFGSALSSGGGGATNFLPIGTSLAIIAARGLLPGPLNRLRLIGPFIPDVTIEEVHVDRLTITRHPVEQGAAITDHAFKEPAQLQMTCGWSNSSPQSFSIPVYIEMIYAGMLALQASRVPIFVLTGKRAYFNMLVENIIERTDQQWENAMKLVIELREIILVQTQTVSVPPTNQMLNPSTNGATQQLGTQSAVTQDPANSIFNADAAARIGGGL